MSEYLPGSRHRKRCYRRGHHCLGEIAWGRVREVGLLLDKCDVMADGRVEV